MITRYSLAVLGILLLTSCTDTWVLPDTTNTGTLFQTGTTDTGADSQPPLVENLSWSGDIYYPIFDGLETKVIPIKHRSGVETKIAFINSEATSMRVLITFPTTETSGNLRFAQIVMPDGNMDGPFGTETTIELTQSGGYELRFHENMMSWDPWAGNAVITITLLGK
jgi:hypothetical protein